MSDTEDKTTINKLSYDLSEFLKWNRTNIPSEIGSFLRDWFITNKLSIVGDTPSVPATKAHVDLSDDIKSLSV